MRRTNWSARAALVLLLALSSTASFPSVLVETATLGAQGDFGGPSLSSDQYLGARFYLDTQVRVTAFGAHVNTTGDIWAAIISLPDIGSLPNFSPITISENAIVYGLFADSGASVDFRITTDTILPEGAYALVLGGGAPLGELGSQMFGATGVGNLVTNGAALTDASPFLRAGMSNGQLTWIDLPAIQGARFVVEGGVIPEPSTVLLISLGLLGLVMCRRRPL